MPSVFKKFIPGRLKHFHSSKSLSKASSKQDLSNPQPTTDPVNQTAQNSTLDVPPIERSHSKRSQNSHARTTSSDRRSETQTPNLLQASSPLIARAQGPPQPHLPSPVAAALNNYDTNPHRVRHGTNLLSDKVNCRVILIYDGKEYTPDLEAQIPWLDRSQYHIYDKAALASLRARGVPDSKQLYRKAGTCRLIRDDNDHEEESRILENERQWSEALPLLVTSFWSRNPYVKFRLEIIWEYSDLSINKVKGQRYAVTVSNLVNSKLQENWHKQEYIPRKDLDEIFSDDTIRELIYSDTSLQELASASPSGGEPLDRDQFIKDISLAASRLLAICIYVDLPLACLYHLMANGFTNVDLPLTNVHCPNDMYRKKFGDFMKWQGGFIAHMFNDDKGRPVHQKLADEVVVPITFDEEADRLGEGGFGEVFRVRIDPDHHLFSTDRNIFFALKRFFEFGSRTKADFDNEFKTLSTLSELPHGHITPHLASWTQNNRFYMLFPCAATNLGHFLRSQPHPELTNDFVKWLLQQLNGLAQGVRHIHNLAPSGLGPDSLTTDLNRSVKRGRAGFHHDLKPQNILVFGADNIGGRPPKFTDLVFKISDFGAAKINDILSKSILEHQSPKTSNLPRGDPIYSAPDYALVGTTSRPYDLWSLGCVFLEVLLWTFDVSGSNLDQFEEDRLRDSSNQRSRDLAFWHRDARDKILLKPSVVNRLKQLQQYCQGRGVFEHLVSSTARLLTIPPGERMDAPKICNELDSIVLQTTFDLRTIDFYKHDIHAHVEVAAPPTRVIGDRSRRPSIDERSIFAPEDGYLRPDTQHRQSLSTGGRPSHSKRPDENQMNGTSPDLERLSPVRTHELPIFTYPHSRSPSIAISDHDAPFETTSTEELDQTDSADPIPPYSAHQYPVGREDFVGRKRSVSDES